MTFSDGQAKRRLFPFLFMNGTDVSPRSATESSRNTKPDEDAPAVLERLASERGALTPQAQKATRH